MPHVEEDGETGLLKMMIARQSFRHRFALHDDEFHGWDSADALDLDVQEAPQAGGNAAT